MKLTLVSTNHFSSDNQSELFPFESEIKSKSKPILNNWSRDVNKSWVSHKSGSFNTTILNQKIKYVLNIESINIKLNIEQLKIKGMFGTFLIV